MHPLPQAWSHFISFTCALIPYKHICLLTAFWTGCDKIPITGVRSMKVGVTMQTSAFMLTCIVDDYTEDGWWREK